MKSLVALKKYRIFSMTPSVAYSQRLAADAGG